MLLDIVSYGRRGPGQRLTISERELIRRTVQRVPEVVVRVTGGGDSSGAVAAHIGYIGRYGELEVETDDGRSLQGDDVAEAVVKEWGLDLQEREARSRYSGVPGRKPAKLVHNIVLSMPAGTPAKGLLAAARKFAQEKFALQHRYVMALHTDQKHYHVHLVVKAVSERGVRLNIRKADLREWRRDFAAALREQGIDANATERAVRGQSRAPTQDGIFRAMLRGDSTHFEKKVQAVADSLRKHGEVPNIGKAALRATRRDVEHSWRAFGRLLEAQGEHELPELIYRFVDGMPPAWTDQEWIAAGLLERSRAARTAGKGVSR